MRRFHAADLRRIRNEVSIRWVIETLLRLPHKVVEGVYRFLCPLCGEFQTGVNRRTNLSRCFRCQRNFNTIELVMQERKSSFVEAVKMLKTSLSTKPDEKPRSPICPITNELELP